MDELNEMGSQKTGNMGSSSSIGASSAASSVGNDPRYQDPSKKVPCCMISPYNYYKKQWDKFIAFFIVFYGCLTLGLCSVGAPLQVLLHGGEVYMVGGLRLLHGFLLLGGHGAQLLQLLLQR